ncbi:MAG: SDR family oxidoreductase [Syntrophobacteraceae bacterium]
MNRKPVLVIGATGYIGGRLVPMLLQLGYRVRTMGRSLAKLEARPWAWHAGFEAVQGDMLDLSSLRKAIEGCWAAYYLPNFLHDLRADYEKTAGQAALNMVAASTASGLERIIYLGWLGQKDGGNLSGVFHSKREEAGILLTGSVPVTYLRASIVLGSGSGPFEIVRYLADRQPVMLAAPWMKRPLQPISIRNIINYLTGCLQKDETIGRTFDIGGPEILTFERLVDIYSEVARLKKRLILPAHFITPRMSALWIHMVTPIPASVVGPIAEELSHDPVCRENRIKSIIPQELLDSRETIRRALDVIKNHRVSACWSDAGALVPPEWTYCGDRNYAGGTIMECGYRVRLRAAPEQIWEHIVRIGGQTGWYYGMSLWRIRGWLDKLFGGTSLLRGRRHPSELYVGDALDFWRVLETSAPSRLLLLSEMKLPGEAILEFKITPLENGETELQQLSRFLPKGMVGLIYWYVLYLAHEWLFRGMLRTISRAVGMPVVKGPERFTPKIHPSKDKNPVDMCSNLP